MPANHDAKLHDKEIAFRHKAMMRQVVFQMAEVRRRPRLFHRITAICHPKNGLPINTVWGKSQKRPKSLCKSAS
jgi:hypothetical protein